MIVIVVLQEALRMKYVIKTEMHTEILGNIIVANIMLVHIKIQDKQYVALSELTIYSYSH